MPASVVDAGLLSLDLELGIESLGVVAPFVVGASPETLLPKMALAVDAAIIVL